MKFLKNIKIIFAVLTLAVLYTHMAFATPPRRPKVWNDPVSAYIVFPAGSFPDENNRFEIEVYCGVHYDIEWLSLEVSHSEEIVFDKEAPGFEGPMKKGEAKMFRVKGTVAKTDEFEMPASARLIIKYRFPYKGVLSELEQRSDANVQYALRELEKVKDEIKTIMKAIPVKGN